MTCAVIAVQTFGDFLGFNPHCHVLLTDGCFYGKGTVILIQNIYAIDPLVCPKCRGAIRIISFIDDVCILYLLGRRVVRSK